MAHFEEIAALYPNLYRTAINAQQDFQISPMAFNAFGLSRTAGQDEYILAILVYAVHSGLNIRETLELFDEAYTEVLGDPEGDNHEIIRNLCKGHADYPICKGVFFGELKEKQFVAITLEKYVDSPFTYLQEEYQSGKRHVYFIDRMQIGGISKALMLLGQFLFEFEGCPQQALPLTQGCTHRIYFPDKRVHSCDLLTGEEKEETKKRLYQLLLRCPDYVLAINALINLV
jgi:hypothetical protein